MMTLYPDLTIGIITYNRLEQLLTVIEAYEQLLIYPRESLHWVISDDGSPNGYKQSVLGRFPHLNIGWWEVPRRGMGANWNRMIFESHQLSEFVLCCQDDWLLTESLDLRLGVRFLQGFSHYGMIRYHKLTGHSGVQLVVQEWDTRLAGLQYHHSENEYVPAMLPYCEILPAFEGDVFSPYSGGVHLRHKRFTEFYGHYLEGYGFSDTEADYMRRVNMWLRGNLNLAQRIITFPHYIESRFRDIAPSTYRNTNTEKETLQDG